MLFLGEGGGGALSLNCLVIEIKYDIFGDAIASSYAHICLFFFIQLKEKRIRFVKKLKEKGSDICLEQSKIEK